MKKRSTGGPAVAIVIPVFKHSVLVAEAIECALAQQCPFEVSVVIVNDGCPFQGTDDVCRDYAIAHPGRITYLRKANGGLSSARNHGISHAMKLWPGLRAIYLLDADNRLRPVAIAKAMATLESGEGCDWVYPSIDMFGLRAAFDLEGEYSRLIHSSMNTCEAGSLVSRRIFEAGVLFDESMKSGFEDWDFYLSAANRGFRGKSLADFGLLYRQRPESMLSDANRDREAITNQMLRKHNLQANPRELVRLEHIESPRYAIYIADESRYVLAVDPQVGGRELSPRQFEQQLWSSLVSPSQVHSPAFLVVTTRQALDGLGKAKLLHWALWKLEDALQDAHVATLTHSMEDGELYAVSEKSAPEAPDHNNALMLMVAPQIFRDVLLDANSTWIDSLLLPDCKPKLVNVEVSCQSDAFEHSCFTAVHSFLAQTHLLRSSAFKLAVGRNWGWRTPGVGLRNSIYREVRKYFGGWPAFPRLTGTGRHIGFVLPIVEFGGVEKVAHQMATAFRARGWTPHLIVLNRLSASLPHDVLAGYESVSFLDGEADAHCAESAFYLGTQLARQADGKRVGRGVGMLYWLNAVVNCHGAALLPMMSHLRRCGVRTVASLHLNDMTEFQRPVGHPYLSLAYEHAYDVMSVCSRQLLDWCYGMGVPLEKLVLMPNAPGYEMPSATVAAIVSGRARRKKTPKVRALVLGRLDRQKGLDRLANVMASASLRGVGVEWRVVGKPVVGESADLPTAVRAVIEAPVHEPHELTALYEWADVLVLLSHYEGLPLTVIEAMRLGVAVMATDVGALREVITDNVSGILLAADHPEAACVDALQAFFGNRRMMVSIGQEGAKEVRSRQWRDSIEELARRLEMPVIRRLEVTV